MDEVKISVQPKITFEIEVETTAYVLKRDQIDALHDAMSLAIESVFAQLEIDATETNHRIIIDDIHIDEDTLADEDWSDESGDFPDEDDEESAEDDY